MTPFLSQWANAALTSVGFFWMALWAFALGYLVSSLIQIVVTREQMQQVMQGDSVKSISLGTFFGFISSSCSFAALATTRTLFAKGAGFVPAMAFLLSSTNLVIELGFVIAIFLGWQFVVAEYIGGVLLILLVWLLVTVYRPTQLIKQVREKLNENNNNDEDNPPSIKQLLSSQKGWQKLGMKYVMEWQMIWRDVLIGFTVAGLIAAFVPSQFFETLFVGSGNDNPAFYEVLLQSVIGPVAAFFTFIGSMGNIPLAAVLFDNGVSFAGVMAFIFSDLVVFPVLRINARYYGWKLALYILALLLISLVATALLLHYGLAMFDLLPQASTGKSITERDMFALDSGFFLNLVFIGISAVLVYFWYQMKHMNTGGHAHSHGHAEHQSGTDSQHSSHQQKDSTPSLKARIEQLITVICIGWLLAGLGLSLFY
ncbi:permease [Salinimonas sediminis]|uniref:Permease n=1 Tax=Salinimonas sediminis TaxID=2303538 RepID=A0A346NIL0_9ALTE|nr:permease [Salinimonas sediminis]AXR05367.1 permease [Salinimonas sediminis]